MQLQDGGLFRDQALIDGIWTVADSGARFEVANPATGTPLANVPDMGRGRNPTRHPGCGSRLAGMAGAYRQGAGDAVAPLA